MGKNPMGKNPRLAEIKVKILKHAVSSLDVGVVNPYKLHIGGK